jgi:hypothetical protein
VEVGQGVTKNSQMACGEGFKWEFCSFQMATYGEAFTPEIDIIPAGFRFQWLQARKALFPEMKQQVQLLFYFKLAFDFVNLSKKFPSFGFQKVVSVD